MEASAGSSSPETPRPLPTYLSTNAILLLGGRRRRRRRLIEDVVYNIYHWQRREIMDRRRHSNPRLHYYLFDISSSRELNSCPA